MSKSLLLKKVQSFIPDLICLIIITTSVFIAWKGILDQSIEGEGFYYFTDSVKTFKNFLTDYDNFPRIGTKVLGTIFQGNMQLYMDFQLATIILLAISIYFFVKSITKNRWISLLAPLFIVINFAGNFQIYGRGAFQWFTQRVFELFPFMLSTYFLLKFIDTKRKIAYLLSFFLFALSLLMTNYTTLLLPFYPSILVITALSKKYSFKNILLYLSLSLPFLILNFLIVDNSSLGPSTIRPNQSFMSVFLQTPDLFYRVSFQLVVNTFPLSFLTFFKTITVSGVRTAVYWLMLPTYLLYFLIFRFLHKQKVPYFNFLLAAFIGLLGTLLLDVYVNRVKNLYDEIFQGRYFYIPSFYTGLIFSFFTANLIPGKKMGQKFIKTIFLSLILLIWVSLNVKLIYKKMHDSQYSSSGGRIMLDYLNLNKSSFPVGSIIFLPSPLMPGGKDFLQKFYNNPPKSIDYQFVDINWRDDIPKGFNPNNLFVFTYNDEFKKGGNSRINKILVNDESASYRKNLLNH